jgi:hypothetical protein
MMLVLSLSAVRWTEGMSGIKTITLFYRPQKEGLLSYLLSYGDTVSIGTYILVL